MTYKLNMFRLKEPLSSIDMGFYGYKIVNLSKEQDRFRILNRLRKEVSSELNAITVAYSPKEGDYILALNPRRVPSKLEIDNFILSLEIKCDNLKEYITPTKRVFYELTRLKLEYHGFWRSTYNKYYSLSPDKTIRGKFDNYRVYRGVFFRYEVFSNFSWLVLDPITRVVVDDSLWTAISKMGEKKIKSMLEKEDRYVVVSQVRGEVSTLRVHKVLRLRTDLRAGKDKVIKVGDKRYSVKGYYEEYKQLPEVANKIDTMEPLIEVEGGMWYAPSTAHLVLRTKDLEGEMDEIRNEIFLTPERRFSQVKRFLDVINPLHIKRYPLIKFEFLEEPACFFSKELEPPDLRFGKDKSYNLMCEGGFENYTRFFKDTLRDCGPVKARVRFSPRSRIALAYPREFLTEKHVRKFYIDVRKHAKGYLGTVLPPKNRIYLWDYSGEDVWDVQENFEKFRDKVKAVICILPGRNSSLYFEFKRIFEGVPCQMVSKDLVLQRYDLPANKKHVYFNSILNLTCGLLGKSGIRPWLLKNKLKGDIYIGVDTKPGKVATFTLIDKQGDYKKENKRPIRGSKIDEETIQDVITNFVMGSRNVLPKGRTTNIIIHKDGEVYPDERCGVEKARDHLKKRGIKIASSIVSIKESVPYRIFREGNGGEILHCPSGIFVKITENMGLLASVGWPLIKQGLSKPLLIELIENHVPSYSLNDAVKEIYYLSFLHWEGIVKKSKMPITIKYADEYAIFAEKGIDITGPPL